jgi:type IV secretion system protein TrbL
MSCDGAQALNPFCQASQIVTSQATGAADSAFSHIAGCFGMAAMNATTWLWQQIDDATTLDLGSPALAKEMVATASIAGVLCLGLFLIQVIASVLRREPGGLGRAVRGLFVSFLGSALALAATRVLLGAVDALSDGVVRYTMGTNIAGLGSKLTFTKLASIANPAVTLIFAVVIIGAVVVVWAAMMIRKMMLLIAAVLAPLAFAGATSDLTRSWVRKWTEFVAAMVVSKLLLVIILSIGVAVLDSAGQVGSGATQVGTQLAAGSLILLMGGFAPWVAIKMFSFAGDTLYAAHATAGQASAGAKTVIAAPQKVNSLQMHARSLAGSGRSAGYYARTPERATPEQYETNRNVDEAAEPGRPVPGGNQGPGTAGIDGAKSSPASRTAGSATPPASGSTATGAGASTGTTAAGAGTSTGTTAAAAGASTGAAAPVAAAAAVVAGTQAAAKKAADSAKTAAQAAETSSRSAATSSPQPQPPPPPPKNP